MKAVLEFNLPEEQQEFELASKAGDWSALAWEISQRLRKHLKYGHEFKSADEALSDIRDFFYEELNDRNLRLL